MVIPHPQNSLKVRAARGLISAEEATPQEPRTAGLWRVGNALIGRRQGSFRWVHGRALSGGSTFDETKLSERRHAKL